MNEHDNRLTEEEVIDGLQALLCGEDIEDTLLGDCWTRTFAEGGYLTRMDNVLKGLDDHEKKLEENLQEMQLRQKGLQEELARDEDYTDLINKYKSKLKKLDKQLGVENDG